MEAVTLPILIVAFCGLGSQTMGCHLFGLEEKLRSLPRAEVVMKPHGADNAVHATLRRAVKDGKSIVLIGHSRGGHTAIVLSRWAHNEGIVINAFIGLDPCGVGELPPLHANVLFAEILRPLVSTCEVQYILGHGLRPTEANYVTIFSAPPRLAADHVFLPVYSETQNKVLGIIRSVQEGKL